MKKPIMLGVLGLFVGYFIYLMIDLLSRGPVDNSIGGYISLAIGAIFFFVGRSYYARLQAISTGQNKGHNIVIFTAVIGIVVIIIIGAVVFMLILKPLSNSRGSSSNSPMNESPSVAAYSTISLKVPGTYVPVIKVPECDQAALQSGTYLCMHFKGLTGPVAAMLPGGGEGLVLKNHPPEDAEYHLMNGADSILVEVHLDFDGDRISFQPAKNNLWTPGLYDLAQSYSYWQEPYNGLNVVYEANDFGQGTGRFEVLELVTSNSDQLIRFAANFEQTVSGGPTFSGYVRFNSSIH